jgi:NAD dependent epimerase/dehydratase family enzyme
MQGAYNAVAPEPVSNKELVLALARRKNFFIPVHIPSFMLRLVLGEMSIEVLKSATVSSEKIRDTGFAFNYPVIDKALDGI